MPLSDEITQADIRTHDLHRTIGAPKPPTNCLARLMASAQGAILLDGTRTDAERLKMIRRKARRAQELRAAFAR